jgi:hypothetical protein
MTAHTVIGVEGQLVEPIKGSAPISSELILLVLVLVLVLDSSFSRFEDEDDWWRPAEKKWTLIPPLPLIEIRVHLRNSRRKLPLFHSAFFLLPSPESVSFYGAAGASGCALLAS